MRFFCNVHCGITVSANGITNQVIVMYLKLKLKLSKDISK